MSEPSENSISSGVGSLKQTSKCHDTEEFIMNFNPKEMGIRISILRQQMGMTQEEFAELNNIIN